VKNDARFDEPTPVVRRAIRLLTSVHINDRGTYEDAVWTVALATKLLRAELARRAAAETAS
jgi:hypothetical protein